MKKALLFIILLFAYSTSNAQLKVASIFSDHMVVQRDKGIAIWGTANPGTNITVSFDKQKEEAKTNKEGIWKLYLKPLKANNKGQELVVTDSKTSIKFEDVLVGDIWIAGGQSNMNYSVRGMGSINADIISKSENNLIRFINVPNKVSTIPQTTFESKWVVSNEKNIVTTTAIGAVFAQKIQPELNVPIGILNVNIGSTSVECWVSEDLLMEEPFYDSFKFWKELENNWDKGAYKPFLKKEIKGRKKKGNKGEEITKENMTTVTETRTYPSGAYNAMLNPLFPFSIKGVIWRQGEANSNRAQQYSSIFFEMANLWRNKFEDKNLPFVLIGLPSYGKKSDKCESGVAEIRESQGMIAEGDNNMYYVSILDLFYFNKNKYSIHPRNKYLAGVRTGNVVLNDIYKVGKRRTPIYKSKEVKGDRVIVKLENVGEGLFTGTLKDLKGNNIEKNNTTANNFWICAEDGIFVRANAKIISKDKIEVWSDKIHNPTNIRYGWESMVLGINLYNGFGFPVPTFRTDNYKLLTEGNVKPKINLVRP